VAEIQFKETTGNLNPAKRSAKYFQYRYTHPTKSNPLFPAESLTLKKWEISSK